MPIDAAAVSEVDIECSTWQQGDAFVGKGLTFVHVADLAKPLTDNASLEAAAGFEIGQSLAAIGTPIPGLVIISQTCDLIRSAADRSYVQVAALRKVEKSVLKEVQRGFRPRLSFIPGLEANALVADLNAIMTVEKSVLQELPRSFSFAAYPMTPKFVNSRSAFRAASRGSRFPTISPQRSTLCKLTSKRSTTSGATMAICCARCAKSEWWPRQRGTQQILVLNSCLSAIRERIRAKS